MNVGQVYNLSLVVISKHPLPDLSTGVVLLRLYRLIESRVQNESISIRGNVPN